MWYTYVIISLALYLVIIMLLITLNNVDITKYYQSKTFSKTEQLNNRANTARLSIIDYRVEENQTIKVFDYTKLKQGYSIGATDLLVEDIFDESNKFYIGLEVWIGNGEPGDERVVVTDVDYTNSIVKVSALRFSHASGEKILIKNFAGIITNVEEDQFGKYGGYQYSVQCTDYKHFMDRENVQDTYINMYSRELFGRMLYSFCARDSQLTLNDFQTAWTVLGGSTALAMANESTDRIQGTNAQKTGTSGSGIATRTKDLTNGGTLPPTNISGYEHLRFRWKTTSGSVITGLKIRIGTNSTNYATYIIPRIGLDYDDCRNRESVIIKEPNSITGTYDPTQIGWVAIDITTTGAIPSGNLLFDIMQVSSGGFTLTNTVRGDRKFEDVRIQHRKVSEVIEDLCKIQGDFWHIDYNRDLVYYTKQGYRKTPFDIISPSSKNYGDLTVEVDTTDLKNRQTVVGGESIEQTLYTQDEVSDGKQDSYRLDYKAKDLAIFVSTDGGETFVPKSVGVENLVDGSTVNFLHNFQEKVVRLGNHTRLSSGHILRRQYYPYKPVSYRFSDTTSIAAMKALTGGNGIYDGALVIDKNIDSQQEAYLRARAEVDLYKNPIITCTFITNYDNIHAGQLIKIVDSNRNLNDDFLVQKVTTKQKAGSYYEYKVTCASSMFGINEFFQLLLKKTARLYLNEQAIVYIVTNIDEVMTLSDNYTITKTSTPYRAGTIDNKHRDFKNQKFTNTFQASGNNQKMMNHRYTENNGTGGSASSECMFESPLLLIKTFDGKPFDRVTKSMLVGKELGTNTLYKSHTPTRDKNGNPQSAMSLTEAGYIDIPYGALTATPNNLSILIEDRPLGTVSGQDYTLLSWAGILITSNQSKISIWTNIGQPSFDVLRSNTGSWEKIIVAIQYNAPNSTIKLYVGGKLIFSQTFSYGPLAYANWVPTMKGHIGAFYPNADNRGYRGDISEIQVYDRILTDRQIQEWSVGYTDNSGLTLVSANASPSGNWPSSWTAYKVKPSTQYEITGYSEIIDALTNDAGGGGIYLRVVGYQTRREGGDSGRATGQTFTQDFISAKKSKHDRERVIGTFTTTNTTQWINIGIYLYNATGVVRMNDLALREIGTETISNTARVEFAICS